MMTREQQVEVALGKIRTFAFDQGLTGEQVQLIFEMGIPAYHQVAKVPLILRPLKPLDAVGIEGCKISQR